MTHNITTADGKWHWTYLNRNMDNITLFYIVGIPAPNLLVGPNALVLRCSTNGVFMVKSSYNSLMENILHPIEGKLRLSWHFDGP